MATVFQRKGSKVWIAALRVWSAERGRFVWVQKPTGTRDKAQAAGIAAMLEQASGSAKAGTMTREKALALVNDILRLAGAESVTPCPSLQNVADELLEAVEVSPGSLRRYGAHWSAIAAWAGKRAQSPISAFTVDDMQELYRDLRKRFSGSTANAHLNFASMIFKRAMARGHRANNPTLGVMRQSSGAVEKGTFTRGETAAILRAIRNRKNSTLGLTLKQRAWLALVSLGWHTGHRIQDLLDVTKASIEGDLLTIQPAKKKSRGGRTVILPLPRWLAKMVVRLGDFKALNHADNRNGKVSEGFIGWMVKAGIDPQRVERGARAVHVKSFHSFRHSMQSRLTAAGVSGELARLVTDHDSPQVARRYVHAEIQSLREALSLARSRKSPES